MSTKPNVVYELVTAKRNFDEVADARLAFCLCCLSGMYLVSDRSLRQILSSAGSTNELISSTALSEVLIREGYSDLSSSSTEGTLGADFVKHFLDKLDNEFPELSSIVRENQHIRIDRDIRWASMLSEPFFEVVNPTTSRKPLVGTTIKHLYLSVLLRSVYPDLLKLWSISKLKSEDFQNTQTQLFYAANVFRTIEDPKSTLSKLLAFGSKTEGALRIRGLGEKSLEKKLQTDESNVEVSKLIVQGLDRWLKDYENTGAIYEVSPATFIEEFALLSRIAREVHAKCIFQNEQDIADKIRNKFNKVSGCLLKSDLKGFASPAIERELQKWTGADAFNWIERPKESYAL